VLPGLRHSVLGGRRWPRDNLRRLQFMTACTKDTRIRGVQTRWGISDRVWGQPQTLKLFSPF